MGGGIINETLSVSSKHAEEKRASAVEKARGAVLAVKASFWLIEGILSIFVESVKPPLWICMPIPPFSHRFFPLQ